jgi:translation initiation factor IF-3
MERAREAGLDLVEVSPMSRPPVCRILDYGKYKYNLAKKVAQSRKKQHVVSIKGMRFRPKIEEHDYRFKSKHIRTFLEQGNKVKCFVLFRGRERAYTEFGRQLLDRLATDLKDIAMIESMPRLEGTSMSMLLSPAPGAVRKKKDQPAAQKTRGEEAAPEAELETELEDTEVEESEEMIVEMVDDDFEEDIDDEIDE